MPKAKKCPHEAATQKLVESTPRNRKDPNRKPLPIPKTRGFIDFGLAHTHDAVETPRQRGRLPAGLPNGGAVAWEQKIKLAKPFQGSEGA